MTTPKTPSDAARALADVLSTHAKALDSTDLTVFAQAMPELRAAARWLDESLRDRGWGNDVLYGLAGPDADDADDADEVEDGVDLDDEDEFVDFDDEDELSDFDEDKMPLNGGRFTYQARFDFVVVNEQALYRRAEIRSLEVDASVDPREGIRDFGGVLGPLGLLLFLDGPHSRDYESAGLKIVYGKEFTNAVERTLDEFDFEVREDQFPSG